MTTGVIILLIVLGVLLAGLVAITIMGRKMQKKQNESESQIRQGAQVVSMLVIDKKRLPMREAGFPQIVIDQTPKYLRRAKVPVVKAKIGPRIASLMCDEKVFPLIPVKKEVKVLMNGIYIIEVKGARGGLETAPEKLTFRQKIKRKLQAKADSMKAKAQAEEKKSGKSKK